MRFKAGHGSIYANAVMKPRNYDQSFVKELIATEIAFGEDISWYLRPAMLFGHGAIVELLLRSGADVNTIPGNGTFCDTPLHEASSYGNEKFAGLLLEKGANIEASNLRGEIPLHCAARNARVAVINFLLGKGANIEARGISGQTPLFFAVSSDHYPFKCDHQTASSMLLKKGANIEAVDNKGRTPLLYAVQNYVRNRSKRTGTFHCRDAIQLLLDKGANINAADNKGWTPLSYELTERWNESKGIFDPEYYKVRSS